MKKLLVGVFCAALMALGPTASATHVAAAGDLVTTGGNTDATTVANFINDGFDSSHVAPTTINKLLLLGDIQYDDSTYCEYEAAGAFADTYAAFGYSKMRPAGGNHEFYDGTCTSPPAGGVDDTGGNGTFAAGNGFMEWFADNGAAGATYSGSGDTTPWYSYTVGDNWLVISVSTRDGSMTSGGWENAATFVANEVQAWEALDPGNICELVYWHHPRWSNGVEHGDDSDMDGLWTTAVANDVDVVLNGHEHHYERFSNMDATGNKVANGTGTREFVVGTGGKDGHQGFNNGSAAEDIASQDTWPNSGTTDVDGVLDLNLLQNTDTYTWKMYNANTGGVEDETPSGQAAAGNCH